MLFENKTPSKITHYTVLKHYVYIFVDKKTTQNP